jgi:hypothetical protein
MSFLKGDEIIKVLPLAALPFAAYGAARSQGMHGMDAWGDPDKNFFDFEENKVRYEDPFVGMTWDEQEDPTMGDRAVAGTLGAAQGLNPFSWAKGGARLAGAGTRAAGRGISRGGRAITPTMGSSGRLAQLGEQRAVGQGFRAMDNPTMVQMPGAPAGYMGYATPSGEVVGSLDELYDAGKASSRLGPSMGDRVDAGYHGLAQAPGKGAQNLGSRMEAVNWGQAPMGTAARVGGRAIQHAGPVAAPWLYNMFGDAPEMQAPGTDAFGGGFGSQGSMMGAAGGAGDAFQLGAKGTSMDNLASGYSQGVGDQEIWDQTGEKWKKNISNRGDQFALSENKIGDNMNIGEDLLNKAKENMYKDNEKKPKKGGGALIMIVGHGKPGPSTEGKPDKLDSEKAK